MGRSYASHESELSNRVRKLDHSSSPLLDLLSNRQDNASVISGPQANWRNRVLFTLDAVRFLAASGAVSKDGAAIILPMKKCHKIH